MLIRVKAIGTGVGNDAVRVDMPTYGLVGIDPVTMLATVDVPDEDAPPGVPAPGTPTRPNTPYGPVLTSVPAQARAQWIGNLRARYPGRGAAWNPPDPQ